MGSSPARSDHLLDLLLVVPEIQLRLRLGKTIISTPSIPRVKSDIILGGSVTEWSQRRTHDLAVPWAGVPRALTTCWICSSFFPSSNPQ